MRNNYEFIISVVWGVEMCHEANKQLQYHLLWIKLQMFKFPFVIQNKFLTIVHSTWIKSK